MIGKFFHLTLILCTIETTQQHFELIKVTKVHYFKHLTKHLT